MLKSKKTQKSYSKTISKNSKRDGAVTVEMALCLPVLFLLLFGCLEMAGANMLRHATESAAYEGARIGILPGATDAGVQQAVDHILTTIGAEGSTVEILPQVRTPETESIQVNVSVPYSTNALIAPFFMSDDLTFRASCTLRREQL